MRLSSLCTALMFLILTASAISYTITYEQTTYGEPGSTANVMAKVKSNGYGGILAYYWTNNGWTLATQSCVSPGSESTVYLPVTLESGKKDVTLHLMLYDYWNLLNGNTCPPSSKDYQSARSAAYSAGSYNFTIQTYAGCDFGYPQCDSNHECIDNACQLKKGCQYNNPPCEYGYTCEQNACLAVITSEIENTFKAKTQNIQESLTTLDQKSTRLIELWTKLNESEKVAYWTKVQTFARTSSPLLSNAQVTISIGKKKSEVVPTAIQYLSDIERARAALRGQNPQTIYIDTSQYIVSAPTPTLIQPTTQNKLDAYSVKSTIKRIANIDKLAIGAKLDIAILDDNGEMRSFLLAKEANDWSVIERSGIGDISLSIISYNSWIRLESSNDVCSELKKQMDRGNIGGITNTDSGTLFNKGYCNIKSCISQEYVPEISRCP